MGSPRYDRSRGPDLYRRSLYTFWKRTVPHPAMITFDAAERNVCIVRRQSTSTPLQALALAERSADRRGGADPRPADAQRGRRDAEGASRLGVPHGDGRSASESEVNVLTRLLVEQKELFKADPKAAAKLLAVGDARNDPKLDTVDAAASTVSGSNRPQSR